MKRSYLTSSCRCKDGGITLFKSEVKHNKIWSSAKELHSSFTCTGVVVRVRRPHGVRQNITSLHISRTLITNKWCNVYSHADQCANRWANHLSDLEDLLQHLGGLWGISGKSDAERMEDGAFGCVTERAGERGLTLTTTKLLASLALAVEAAPCSQNTTHP